MIQIGKTFTVILISLIFSNLIVFKNAQASCSCTPSIKNGTDDSGNCHLLLHHLIMNAKVTSEVFKRSLEQHRHLLNHVDIDGNTPLHLAAEEGRSDFVIILLDAGAELFIHNKENYTPRKLVKFYCDLEYGDFLKALENVLEILTIAENKLAAQLEDMSNDDNDEPWLKQFYKSKSTML